MKKLAALAAAVLFATAAQAQETWSPFVFHEEINPITDAATWRVFAAGTSSTVTVGCFSDEPGKVMVSLRDGATDHSGIYDGALLKVRFDKDAPLEFHTISAISFGGRAAQIVFGASASNASILRFSGAFPGAAAMMDHPGYSIVPKILDGLRKKTMMAFQIDHNTPVVVPLPGSTAAMAKLDAKCPALK